MVVAAAFLHLPLISRLLLLIIIVSNAAAEISYNTSLDFAGMTAFIFSTSIGMYVLIIQCQVLSELCNAESAYELRFWVNYGY